MRAVIWVLVAAACNRDAPTTTTTNAAASQSPDALSPPALTVTGVAYDSGLGLATPWLSGPPVVETTVAPITPPIGDGGGGFAKASALALNGDQAGARAILEPKVMSGKGTRDEVSLLKGICKAQGDTPCVQAIKKLYR